MYVFHKKSKPKTVEGAMLKMEAEFAKKDLLYILWSLHFLHHHKNFENMTSYTCIAIHLVLALLGEKGTISSRST